MIDPEGLDVIVVGPCWTLTIPVLTCLDHPALKRKPGAVVDPDLLKFQQKQKKSGWDPRQLLGLPMSAISAMAQNKINHLWIESD